MTSFTCWNLERPVQWQSDFDNEFLVVNFKHLLICTTNGEAIQRSRFEMPLTDPLVGVAYYVAENIAKRKTSEKKSEDPPCMRKSKKQKKTDWKQPTAN